MIESTKGHARRISPVLAALAVAAAVFGLRRVGALQGLPAIAFAALLAVCLPCSACLSRRLLLVGAIVLGWMPLLWWVRLPVPQVDRVGLTLAVVSGALVGWVLRAPGIRARARLLIPRVSCVDAMPVAAAAIAVWTTWPLLSTSQGERTLNVLMTSGWDNVAHVAMVMLIRTQGAIGPMLGLAPDHSRWAYTSYPQHFHATVAALTDLYSGTAVGSVATQVLTYGRCVALVQVLTAGLLAAGVAQLPSLRRRAGIAWPLGALAVAAYLFGPGAWALSSGFPNFVLACATASLAILLAVPMTRELVPLRVFALGGLVVATVHGWALLAPLALVAASVAFVPFGRTRWPHSRRGSLATAAALLATAAASAAVIPMLASVGGLGVLTIAGGNPVVSMSLLLLAGGMAIATALGIYVRGRDPESAVRSIALAAIPGTGLLLLGLIAAYQLLRKGDLSYYFYKLAVGVTLISIVVLVVGVAIHLGPPLRRRNRPHRLVAVIAAIVATLAASQLFGYAGPPGLGRTWKGLDLAQGMRVRIEDQARMRGPLLAAERLLHAVAIAQRRPFASTVYVAAMPGDIRSALLADYWQRALSLTWSSASNAVDPILPNNSSYDAIRRAAEVTQLLQAAPDRAIVVAPEIAGKLRGLLPADLRGRVITW